MDGGVITKTLLGRKSTGPNPSHRQTEVNQVQKCSILVVDGKGVPIGVYVDGANRQT